MSLLKFCIETHCLKNAVVINIENFNIEEKMLNNFKKVLYRVYIVLLSMFLNCSI